MKNPRNQIRPLPRKQPAQRAFTGLQGRFSKDDYPVEQPVPQQASPAVPPQSIEADRKRKDAERKRDARKQRREQLAAVREILRRPDAEIVKAAQEKITLAPMSRGAFISGAPQGKGLLVTGGWDSKQVERVEAIGAQSELLGEPTGDSWPTIDRRVVRPEGTGQADEESASGTLNDEGMNFSTPVLRSNSSFVVKDTTSIEWGQALIDLFHRYFVIGKTDQSTDETFICRFCDTVCNSERICKQHLEQVHGNEDEEKHDHRFGNVIARYVRELKRSHRPKRN